MRITGIVRPFFVAAVLAALSFAGAPAVADDMSGMGNMSGMPGMSTAAGIEMTHIAGPYRVVLDLLPAERFYTRAQAARHAGAGMIVIGGAAPVQPGSRLEPNHHLVVHLYDRASGKAVRGAHVTITYAPAGSMMSMTLPVVEMQMAGAGPASTHYGNNVKLARGTYHVVVTANGFSTSFVLHVT